MALDADIDDLMRAVVVERYGDPDVLEARLIARPGPSAGHLVVRVDAAGVNFRDVVERSGGYRQFSPVPFVPGMEGAGTVSEVGTDVAGFAPGDRVAWTLGRATYADVVSLPAAAAVRLPAGVSTEQAAAVLAQGLTAHYLCTSAYPVRSGDVVVVHAAAGGVGRLLTQMVRLRGGIVIATASSPDKRQHAASAGADHVCAYDEFADLAREVTGGGGVRAVFDGVGAPTFDTSLDCLGRRGILVQYGDAGGRPAEMDLGRLAMGSKVVTRPALIDFMTSPAEVDGRVREIFGGIADGRLEVALAQRFPVEEASAAHRLLESRQALGKIVLDLSGPSRVA